MLLRALALCLLFSGPALADGGAFPGQAPQSGPSHSAMSYPPTAAATYVGPFDAAGATLAHCVSLRACSAAIAAAGTQPIINVTGGGHACDILPATNGGLGNTSSGCAVPNSPVATFCTSTCT